MAQLKDTLIQGSARVTDTLYANDLNGVTISTNALKLIKATDAVASNQTQITMNNGYTEYAAISYNTTGALNIRSKRIIAISPAQNSTAATPATNYSGVYYYLNTDAFYPSDNNAIALGKTNYKWSSIYSTSEYTDNIILTTTSDGATLNLNQIDYVGNNSISYAKISASTNGVLSLFAKRIIVLYPAGLASSNASTALTNEYQNAKGVYIDTDYIYPVLTDSMTLGQSAKKWANIYSTTATLNGLDIIGGDLVMSEASGHGATHKIIFQRGTATDGYTNWKLYNDSVGVFTLQAYHNGLAGDTDIVEILPPTSAGQIPTIQPGITDSYKLGTSSLQWLSTYSKEFIVDAHVTLAYNSSDLSLNFNFS